MPRGRCAFTQSTVARAVKAVLKAGVEVDRVEISQDGKIVVFVRTTISSNGPKDQNEWDEVL